MGIDGARGCGKSCQADEGERAGEVLIGQVVSRDSCKAVRSLSTSMSDIPHCWPSAASAQLETALVEKTSGAPICMLGDPLLANNYLRQRTVAEMARVLQPKGVCHRWYTLARLERHHYGAEDSCSAHEEEMSRKARRAAFNLAVKKALGSR